MSSWATSLSIADGWETGPGYSIAARACLGKLRNGAVEVEAWGTSSGLGDDETATVILASWKGFLPVEDRLRARRDQIDSQAIASRRADC